MKQKIERREIEGSRDYFALALTTWGVGYLPVAPGTWGSMVGVAIYLGAGWAWSVSVIEALGPDGVSFVAVKAWGNVLISLALLLLTILGIWASGRSSEIFGNSDPSEAVVDEVIGQLITFLFIPFTMSWPMVLAGFLLFRLFDIWKPYPIDDLQNLPAGIGVCADDILAGVYAGLCLGAIEAIRLSL